ncbi:beta-1,6-N-acetylglucosaminyltransferase [Halomonas elongata]|uniref:Peptide O-xylosyltransferase n=1 Tax=Halomonas elongata (strain ATCC 33173 / DSM 2581 / NBRC 15536 / NCIMB 2198 / 1H9) TaxID=768066 RepID=A0ABZ0TCC2_HALED|nr:beta-1,6-N-acetylglucosaminyltransferase [Halomonas elongata]WBF19552.1 beta-1,6-N-acetylglucosaminyltransferase [Halomonas elongata]WPU48416.1 beta-1,6-N-acetylglucosaminyltransferase [Halomonas elongata DSM 2581]
MAGNSLVTITFIVLCHDSAERVIDLVRQLLTEDPECQVIIHLDKKSPKTIFQKLALALDGEPRCHLMRNRVRCGWGQWGLVEAPLRALRYALEQTDVSDYFYLISEYCRPVRPLSELREFLTAYQGTDFIECETSDWIKGGIREDRYLYRHYLDKRKYPKLHRWMYRAQKYLKLKRPMPKDFEVRFGSQWWCLSKDTVFKLFDDCKRERRYKRLRTAWVPDECYFQTIVYHEFSETVSDRSLTYVRFDREGRASNLNYQDFVPDGCFFARKYYLTPGGLRDTHKEMI